MGTLAEGGGWTPVLDVSATATTNLPSLLCAEHLAGNLWMSDLANYGFGNLQNTSIGTQGYLLFGWGGPGINLTNLNPGFTITQGPGWQHVQYLGRQYKIGNTLGTNYGLMANPSGTINIATTDTNYHILTVISPAKFTDPRNFTLSLVSSNGTSSRYNVNEAYGFNHTFQFLFKGNVTLVANASSGGEATVQAFFLDDAAIQTAPRLLPPSDLHVVK